MFIINIHVLVGKQNSAGWQADVASAGWIHRPLSLGQVVQIIDWHVHLGVPGMPLLPAFTAARYVPSELPINVLNRQADAACAHWMRYHRCDCPRSWEGPNDGFGNVSWQVPDLHDLQHKHDGPPSSALFSPQCAENVTQWLDNALRPTRVATWCAAWVITAPAVTG